MGLTSLLFSLYTFWQSLYTFIFYTWPLLLLGILFFLRQKWKKYPIEAVIIEKRGENLIKTNDRLGKKEDKYTGMNYYQFAKSKDTIPVMNYEWILHNKAVHTNFLERLINLIRPNEGAAFLFKYGSKQYKPIPVSQKNPEATKKLVPIKNEKGEKVYVYQYQPFDPRGVLRVLDFDVVDWDNMNFMVQEQRASIERRTKRRDKFMQMVIPITIIAAALIISIFILKFSYDAGASLRGGGTAPKGTSGGGSKIMGAIQNKFTPGQ